MKFELAVGWRYLRNRRSRMVVLVSGITVLGVAFAVMALLVVVSWLTTRRLTSSPQMSRWQNFLEIIVGTINSQIRDVTQQKPERYLPFIGTLFLFIVISNLLAVVPGFYAPTASLSTTGRA